MTGGEVGGIELAVMVGMIAFNSVFAAYEIALASVSPARLKVLAGENRGGAASAVYMKENVEASLSAVQLGITLFGAVAAATGGAGAEESFAPWFQSEFGVSKGLAEFLAVTAIVVPLTAVTIVAGELVPKVFALRNNEWVCLRLSPAMKWFTFSVWPIVWLFETLVSAITDWGERRFRGAAGEVKTEAAELQDLRAVATLARTSRLIGACEEGIIHGAAKLSARPVRDIMIPAAGISMLDANASLADALTAAHLEMHTRFPVTTRAGDPQAIVGYANFKDIVAVLRLSPADPSLRGLTRPILSFPDTDSIAQCLEHLLRGNAHIALVRDAGGRCQSRATCASRRRWRRTLRTATRIPPRATTSPPRGSRPRWAAAHSASVSARPGGGSAARSRPVFSRSRSSRTPPPATHDGPDGTRWSGNLSYSSPMSPSNSSTTSSSVTRPVTAPPASLTRAMWAFPRRRCSRHCAMLSVSGNDRIGRVSPRSDGSAGESRRTATMSLKFAYPTIACGSPARVVTGKRVCISRCAAV
ncbi:MAG TPA: CNNM domain-containing protein, partial [Gemmata sp.]|nr:CNNM domain-containing protein [Gemmata sp.]